MRFWYRRPGCRLLGVLGVVLGHIAAAAADSGSDAQGWDPTRPALSAGDLFRQRVFRRSDGLPSDTILALKLARDGALWIGTGAGLVRYDGRVFRTYDHVSHPEFVSDEVRAVDEGPDGRVWVGTADGLLEFRGSQALRRWTESDGLADGSIYVVEACRDGSVWFGTRRALHRIRDGRVESWPDLFAVESDGGVVGEILEDRDGRIHVCPGSIPEWIRSKGTALSFENDRSVYEWKDPSPPRRSKTQDPAREPGELPVLRLHDGRSVDVAVSRGVDEVNDLGSAVRRGLQPRGARVHTGVQNGNDHAAPIVVRVAGEEAQRADLGLGQQAIRW